MSFEGVVEEIEVRGRDLVEKIRELIHQGNVTRIIIKDKSGATFIEIPVTVGTIGVVLAPILVFVGTLAALIANFKIVVERVKPKPVKPDPAPSTSIQSGK
jgi:hypothetical protein